MAANNGAIKLVAGNSNRALSEAIGAYLQTPLTKAEVRRFADMRSDKHRITLERITLGAGCVK